MEVVPPNRTLKCGDAGDRINRAVDQVLDLAALVLERVGQRAVRLGFLLERQLQLVVHGTPHRLLAVAKDGSLPVPYLRELNRSCISSRLNATWKSLIGSALPVAAR